MVKNIREITECPDCACPELVYNERKQQVVCKDCGLIYEPLTPKEEESYLGPQTNEQSLLKKQKKASKTTKQR